MFDEDDLLPLSALQHLIFCERQCALIHIEQVWADNPLTVEGGLLHERVDSAVVESRTGVRFARRVALHSLRLGVTGKADVVEFHRVGDDQPGAILPGVAGHWVPFPVEYKRGRPKLDESDRVQLCAQALCLEEMLYVPAPAGALFYGRTRRRFDVAFDVDLRARTEAACARLHDLLASGRTPVAVREPKCARCSLLDICKPDAPRRSARDYLDAALGAR
jgi:CRISPR-associated exonuclease Cas4